jgi:hypothetical protein
MEITTGFNVDNYRINGVNVVITGINVDHLKGSEGKHHTDKQGSSQGSMASSHTLLGSPQESMGSITGIKENHHIIIEINGDHYRDHWRSLQGSIGIMTSGLASYWQITQVTSTMAEIHFYPINGSQASSLLSMAPSRSPFVPFSFKMDHRGIN